MSGQRYPLDPAFSVDVHSLTTVARGLRRPECVVALANGQLLAAHGAGGYSVIQPGAEPRHVIAATTSPYGSAFLPNGIALAPNGRVLFADLGPNAGGIFEIDDAAVVTPVLSRLDGEPLPPSNFVMIDEDETLWFTISTRLRPRTAAWKHSVADGYIGVVDRGGARIVADGIGYTNEIAFSPDGDWLYVNETYNQRISRFRRLGPTTLGAKEIVAQLSGADLPDGLAFDAYGGAWITCIGSNRLLVLRPDGTLQCVLSDTDPVLAARITEKIAAGTLTQEDMSTAGTSRLANISSLAFGGPDLRTAYLGCLLGDSIRSFESPVPGWAPAHWHRRLEAKKPGTAGQKAA